MSKSLTNEIKESLDIFYSRENNFNFLLKILGKEKKISLRVLEFAASNSHMFKTSYKLCGLYQTFLDSAGKRNFDAFKRHESFEYQHPRTGKIVRTNVAQLRFLRFAKESGIVQWLEDPSNIKEVEQVMKSKSKQSNQKRKRKKVMSCAVGAENVLLTLD